MRTKEVILKIDGKERKPEVKNSSYADNFQYNGSEVQNLRGLGKPRRFLTM